MGMQLRAGEVIWTQDLDGSTATTAYPTAATEGVALPSTFPAPRAGTRVHVALRYQVGLGTVSTDVHLYGYTSVTVTGWWYLGSLNSGNSITSNLPKWNPDNSTVAVAEYFVSSGQNFSRYKTRCIAPQGTSPLVSTWIGFERE